MSKFRAVRQKIRKGRGTVSKNPEMPWCSTNASYFQVFQAMSHFTFFGHTAKKLGRITNFHIFFLATGFDK